MSVPHKQRSNIWKIHRSETEQKYICSPQTAILLVINRCGFSVSEHLFVWLTNSSAETKHTEKVVHLDQQDLIKNI